MTTGEKIAQLRKQLGMTQAKLAEKAGISTSAVAMYETNRRQPDAATSLSLAKALNVPARTLLVADELIPNDVTAESAMPSGYQQAPITGAKTQKNGEKGKPSSPAVLKADHKTNRVPVTEPAVDDEQQADNKTDGGFTSLALSRDEARFILFVRMHPDTVPFLQDFMTADDAKRKQIEKAWRLIQAFQA